LRRGRAVEMALTAHTELPPLPEADAASLLQLEAERGFPCDPATLRIADSRCALAEGRQHVLLAGIPGAQLAALENALTAAKLKPVSFALASRRCNRRRRKIPTVCSRWPWRKPGDAANHGRRRRGGAARARRRGGNEAGTGVAREAVAREVRITLGQLPPRCANRSNRSASSARANSRSSSPTKWSCASSRWAWPWKIVTAYAPDEFGVQLRRTLRSRRRSASRRGRWRGRRRRLNFCRRTRRPSNSSSRSIHPAGCKRRARCGGDFVLVGGAFFIQQIQLWRLRSQWSAMAAKVGELDGFQQQIRQYRPWYDESFAR